MFELINKVKEINPLVIHYTNEVTINDCANITLALGASPLMSYSNEEVEEVVSIASSVVINIGTMNSSRLDLFVKAGKAANKFNKPVILDPVGVFATKTRTDFTNKLLNEIKFDVVKGNVAEIKFIGGLDVRGQGVDSFDDGEDISEVIKKIAKKIGCIVVATGKIDFISDGNTVIKIFNGTSKLKSVTGTGCMTGSLIGSYLGAYNNLEGRERDNFKKVEAVAMGVLTMAVSGELADKDNISIGTFKEELMNNVYEMNIDKLKEYGRIE
ncbi:MULTISPECIES: hydroxyethylthiazole kinase [Clostridia]|jgi:hydroxyethylthiazole kinase|uniref:Hydroxyethylthiazole kinase n=1 Tax=Clostridium saudiense TaxID=1414720 RepID=A0ABS2FDQ6_9CLOT|nr:MULTISPECIES: hydroxyethylthiazole kinase [Clostridiaceae]MBM6818073.1 hydroxyethylthiazole kinase [Clostridium saudiense]